MNIYTKQNLSIKLGDKVKIDGYYTQFEYSSLDVKEKLEEIYKVAEYCSDENGEYLKIVSINHPYIYHHVSRHSISKIDKQNFIKIGDIKIGNSCIIGKDTRTLPYIISEHEMELSYYGNSASYFNNFLYYDIDVNDMIFKIIENINGIVRIKSMKNEKLNIYLPHFVLCNIDVNNMYSPKKIQYE